MCYTTTEATDAAQRTSIQHSKQDDESSSLQELHILQQVKQVISDISHTHTAAHTARESLKRKLSDSDENECKQPSRKKRRVLQDSSGE